MNGFKRFCLVIFALAGRPCRTCSYMVWSWTEIASNLLLNEVYLIALSVHDYFGAGFTVCLLMVCSLEIFIHSRLQPLTEELSP